MANGKRLLFFDLLRILSVAAIVFSHISRAYNIPFWGTDNLILNIFYIGPGPVGVALLIFVSGAVLEYAHPKLSTINEISEFYVKRVSRIYPAYWISFLFGLVFVPYFISSEPWFDTFLQFIGFYAWYGKWGGPINNVGWFVGLIIVLYLSYPILSHLIRKYPYQTILIITIVEITLRYFLNAVYCPPVLGTMPDRWLPCCNLIEFSLGIFIVQQGCFPKSEYSNRALLFLAELSFYVFLVHGAGKMMVVSLVSLPLYIIAVMVFAWLVMLCDIRIQVWVGKRVLSKKD